MTAPTVIEKIEYALQAPNAKITSAKGEIGDETNHLLDRRPWWTADLDAVIKLRIKLVEGLHAMGVNNGGYDIVSRRIITVTTSPTLTEF